MIWQPISLKTLQTRLAEDETQLNPERRKLWNAIKIPPEKWQQDPYGNEGGGFWVVGLIGRQCLYYNDIEGGFEWSRYTQYGLIEEYVCNQDTLDFAIHKVMDT